MTKPATYAYLDDQLRVDALRIESKAPEERTEAEAKRLEVLARFNEAYRKRDEIKRELEGLHDELREKEQEWSASVLEFLRQIRDLARSDLAKLGWVLDEDLRWISNGVIHDAPPNLPQAEILDWGFAIDKTFERGKAEIGFGYGLETAGLLIAAGYTSYLDRFISLMQSMRAKKPRRPRSPAARAIRYALAKGKESAAEVVAFLEGTPEIRDEWGLMEITDEGDQLVVEDLDGPKDDGEYPEGMIPKSGKQLSVLVSKAKKNQ